MLIDTIALQLPDHQIAGDIQHAPNVGVRVADRTRLRGVPHVIGIARGRRRATDDVVHFKAISKDIVLWYAKHQGLVLAPATIWIKATFRHDLPQERIVVRRADDDYPHRFFKRACHNQLIFPRSYVIV
jgi:hypothetical protein